MIAHDPLHGSGRAALPHPALALGDNAEAHEGIGMANVGGWQPPVDVASHPPPRQMMALAAALEGPPPKPTDGRAKGANTAPVHGHAVVPHVPGYDRAQISSYRRERLVQTSPEFGLDRLELRLPSLAHRLPQHREPSLSRPPAAMREAEKVEGLRFPVATPSPGPLRVAAELDEPRLVGVQRQPELREPLAQLGEEPLGLLPMLESHDEVVREAHQHHISVRLLRPPPLDPEIEHVVQIDVGQQRTDTPALYRADLTPCSLPILQHAGVQPFLDEAHDAPVRNPMLDELHQPPVVEGVEEPTDIGIEHPVHPLRRDPDRESIERPMRAAPRPEPVREPEKVDLVDRIQDPDDRALHQLVLQRGNAERPQPPVGLRDEHSPDRLRPVRPSREPSREILKIRFQGLAIVLPRLAVDPRRRVSLQRVVRGAQVLDVVHVVQERREPLFPIPFGCLTHPVECTERACPARCPERVALARVPLGPPPPLHCLRGRSLGLVRQFPRYYGAVRLPVLVHHRRSSLDFPMRSAAPSATDERGISRFPYAVLGYVRGVSDRAGSVSASRYRHRRCRLPLVSTASAPRSESWISRLNTRPVPPPVNASRPPLRAPTHDSGPAWLAMPSPDETFIHCTAPV